MLRDAPFSPIFPLDFVKYWIYFFICYVQCLLYIHNFFLLFPNMVINMYLFSHSKYPKLLELNVFDHFCISNAGTETSAANLYSIFEHILK
jgi:hypothetical protein